VSRAAPADGRSPPPISATGGRGAPPALTLRKEAVSQDVRRHVLATGHGFQCCLVGKSKRQDAIHVIDEGDVHTSLDIPWDV
jgi:hypothetical protein